MTKFYGWIPHLFPSFEMKYSNEEFLKKLIPNKDQEKVNNNYETEIVQTINNTIIKIKFIINANFDYNADNNMKTEVDIENSDKVNANITVLSSGLFLFESEEIKNNKGETKEIEKQLMTVSEAWFELKKLYQYQYEPDDIKDTGRDDALTLVQAEDESEAIKKIFSRILNKCEQCTTRFSELVSLENRSRARRRKIWKRKDNNATNELAGSQYVQASEFIAYGLSFINIFRETPGMNYNKNHESLETISKSI